MLVDEPWLYELTDLDHQVFRQVVRPDHPLAKALECIPWEDFRGTLESYYSRNLGQPAIDPLRMLKLEFLRYQCNLSDRQVIDRLATDFSFRYFLQVGIHFRLPDSSLLCRFRGRLGSEGFQEIFQKLVSIAREQGLVKDRLRLKDASHVIANIAVPTTLKLVAQARDRLLAAVLPWGGEAAEGQRIDIELMRERTATFPPSERLEARVTQLQEMLSWAETLSAPDDASNNTSWQKLVDACELVRKILFDQGNPKAGHRTLSVVDSEARRGKHGDWYDGYVVDIMMDADSELITELNTLEAGGDEAKDAVELVRREQETHGNDIEEFSIDGAGFNGAMLHELEDPEGLNVKTFVPPKQEVKRDVFTPREFTASEDKSHVTCPSGEASRYRQRDKDSGFLYRFTRQQCDACPLVQQCVAKPGEGAFGRTVRKSDYESDYQRARDRAQTEEYACVRKEHPAIERKLNEVMNHHGGRCARYWGLSKVHAQECMACLTVNVKQMVKLLTARSTARVLS